MFATKSWDCCQTFPENGLLSFDSHSSVGRLWVLVSLMKRSKLAEFSKQNSAATCFMRGLFITSSEQTLQAKSIMFDGLFLRTGGHFSLLYAGFSNL